MTKRYLASAWNTCNVFTIILVELFVLDLACHCSVLVVNLVVGCVPDL